MKILYLQAKKAFMQDKPLSDITLPLISYYAGRKMDKMLRKNFGGEEIEDQWINFFCISSNLSRPGMVIHRRGLFWKSIRASLSIPGALPPVVFENDLLVDGALMNNLPVDIMADMGVGKIIAIDLNKEKHYKLDYQEMPSSFQILKNKFSFRKKRLKVPSLMSIISKSTLLASFEKASTVHNLADWFLNPPVENFGLLDFKKFEQISAIGYQYTDELLKAQPELSQQFV